ncbi:thioredoxin 1 [Aurantimicrobium minutum]|uniref:thioredoxin n=1 Tax=Aurantimicrobium minutum TaxID=708131 RepID=UPI00247586AC|nr:thioredoxin [Aurantimicrobium minutum]MDH6532852.1 thioredoxin 1 [Aurantimicrobium minutum]
MASVELTQDNFDTTITENDIVVVDFWADWCGPCKMFAPTFEAASDKFPEIVFGKVDTEAEQSLAGAAGIQSIPTLMVFREKILLFSQAGALPPAALDDLLAQVQGLDMVAVHAEVEKQRSEMEAE